MNLTLALIGANFLGTTILATLVLRKRPYTGNGETLAKLNVAVMQLTDAVTALNLEVDLLKQKGPFPVSTTPPARHAVKWVHAILSGLSAGLVTMSQTSNWKEALITLLSVGVITKMAGAALRDYVATKGG